MSFRLCELTNVSFNYSISELFQFVSNFTKRKSSSTKMDVCSDAIVKSCARINTTMDRSRLCLVSQPPKILFPVPVYAICHSAPYSKFHRGRLSSLKRCPAGMFASLVEVERSLLGMFTRARWLTNLRKIFTPLHPPSRPCYKHLRN